MKRQFVRKGSIAGGNKVYKTWKDYSEGDMVVGTYLGTHTDKYDKVGITLRVLDCEFLKDDAEKFIDKELVLNSCGTIQRCLDEDKFEVGKHYQVTYGGLIMMDKGKFAGKEAHSVSIEEIEIVDSGESDDSDYL